MVPLFTRCLACLFLLGTPHLTHTAEPIAPEKGSEKVPPPYVFNLGGLSDDDVAKIKEVPGALEVAQNGHRTRVVWRPFNVDREWRTPEKWTNGAERIFDYLAARNAGTATTLGGGYSGNRSGAVVVEQRGAVSFVFRAVNEKRSRFDVDLRCYNEALPGQVEHEMLRGVPGTDVTIEKCGEGYAVVSRAGRGTFVVWQVSEQMFVRIDNILDREMVAAYIARLGSITPKDYKVSVDEWVQNEIKWRIVELHWLHELELRLKGPDRYDPQNPPELPPELKGPHHW